MVGAIVWVVSLTYLGYGFGNLPFVKKNFEIVILAIIFLSILPAAVEIARGWLASRSRLPVVKVGG